VVEAAEHVIAVMGSDVRHGRLDARLKPEEASALRRLDRAVRRTATQPKQNSYPRWMDWARIGWLYGVIRKRRRLWRRYLFGAFDCGALVLREIVQKPV
jgi:hypothetical protein